MEYTLSIGLSFVLVLPLLIVSWFVYKKIEFYVWKLPPGPLGVPFLGYIPFVTSEPQKKLNYLSKKYGPLFSVSLGSYRAVVASDYEIAKQLLNHPAALSRPPKFFDVLPGKGGFSGMNCDVWQEQRKVCTQALHLLGPGKSLWEKNLQMDVEEIVEYIQKYKGRPTDLGGPVGRSIRANVVGFLLGRRFPNMETNPEVDLLERTHSVASELFNGKNPVTLIPWLLKSLVKFNIAGYAKKIEVLEEFGDLLRREIKKHQDSKDNYTDSLDFIGHYLEALDKKNGTDEIKNYTVQNLEGHMAALFFGGSNSTVASIKWLTLLMATYPEVQKRVHDEIDAVIGRDVFIVCDDRKRLPFTMATILEMQRWIAVVPFFPPRCASETFEFRGYKIPKNTMIVVNCWAIQRSPKYWDDPHRYMPERFLPAVNGAKVPSRLVGYAPFSFGRRSCPGDTMAIVTIFLYFTRLMQKFKITSPPGLQVDMSSDYSPVVHPKDQKLCFIERSPTVLNIHRTSHVNHH